MTCVSESIPFASAIGNTQTGVSICFGSCLLDQQLIATVTYMSYATGGTVTLRIYDVAGHLVTELVNRFQPAGYHSVTWVGTGRTGRPVASGVYFVQMKSPTFTQSRKLVLLK